MNNDSENQNVNFLRDLIREELESGRVSSPIVTRFPPEPNGYLHIGHARSIWLNFGLAEHFDGHCNLRFDDTNPEKESQVYVDSIQEDVKWLGYDWHGDVKFASDYFEQFYEWGLHLIQSGDAYVCHLSPEESSEYRGWAIQPGKDSPYRNRDLQENLDAFEKMKRGEFDEGGAVLRAKIDMASPNMNLRDPILYRVRKVSHHQTGDKWCIYPSYDFAHGQEDAIEGISHSICTLEFADHRALYEWFIDKLPVPSKPRQFEFGRLNLNYTVTSKRKLKRLVDEGVVEGWDDPRMPTIAGLRRRGYTPSAIKNFCDMVPVSGKGNSDVDVALLEHAIRDDLNQNAPRAMVVKAPLKVTFCNFSDISETDLMALKVANHPNKPELGEREIKIGSEIYIDRSDFSPDTTLSRKKFKRLVPEDYVRLRGAFIIKAESFEIDSNGEVSGIVASIVPHSVGANVEGVKPRGVIHWVDMQTSIPVELRLFDRLFQVENPDSKDLDLLSCVNPDSKQVIQGHAEPMLALSDPEQVYQFEREGYFVSDRHDHNANRPVYNLTIGLREALGK